MKIILMRHGQAEDYKKADSTRQLTEFGKQQAQQTADYIFSHYQPDMLIVSPYDRAQQTMQAISQKLPAVEVIVYEHITPKDDAKHALLGLEKIVNEGKASDKQCVVIVCHMAIIAHLAALLTDDMPESFQLAEARVFEAELMVQGLAKEVKRFVPKQP